MQSRRPTFESALAPSVRALLAIPVALFLAGVVTVAAGASSQAVAHMTAQIQHTSHDGAGHSRTLATARQGSTSCPATRPEAG